MTADELIRRYGIQFLYHFTDEANLESIGTHGGLYSVEDLERRGIDVSRPGGNDWSRDADALKGFQRYVHLSFIDDHPMKFLAEQDGRIGPVRTLFIDAKVLSWPGVIFTADVSNKSGVLGLNLNEAIEQIDFEVIYTRTNWRDKLIQERRRQAKKAEILVPQHIPLSMMGGF
jgi:hypothetical protein